MLSCARYEWFNDEQSSTLFLTSWNSNLVEEMDSKQDK